MQISNNLRSRWKKSNRLSSFYKLLSPLC